MNLQKYYPDFDPYFKLYCVESVVDTDKHSHSGVWPFLEKLVTQYNIHNIYKACDDFESFESSLDQLIYEDLNTSDFKIIYLIMEGNANEIIINNHVFTLEELAELFEGKLKNKILHFANTKYLDLEEESFQYFLDVTGATAISGYAYHSSFFSAALDLYYFSFFIKIDDMYELVHKLYETHAELYHSMGFKVYY